MENCESIEVHYDGQGQDIKSHLMPSKLVSQSVCAFDILYKEAFKEANKIYNTKLEANTYIQGGFEAGSLKWLQKIVSKQNEEQLLIDDIAEEGSFKDKITKAITEAIGFLSRISSDMPEIRFKETKDGISILVDSNGTYEPTNELVCALLTNKKAKKAISDLSQPLKVDGIDSLTITGCGRSADSPKVKILKASVDNLTTTKHYSSVVEEGSFSGLYKAEDLSYNPENVWKFVSIERPSDSFKAKILDDLFWQEVASRKQKFVFEDVMRIEGTWTKTRKSMTGNSSTIYVINKIEHFDKDDDLSCKQPLIS
ncbi:hypothetical protein [Photobacterium leiognathi]|uniref:hypothetical protein n=1 Tax=Photobacterium leiognathi TaxID=553611 RepID=UPI002735EC61|nr:hypothetical protein [Photobacterium leiognathi]